MARDSSPEKGGILGGFESKARELGEKVKKNTTKKSDFEIRDKQQGDDNLGFALP